MPSLSVVSPFPIGRETIAGFGLLTRKPMLILLHTRGQPSLIAAFTRAILLCTCRASWKWRLASCPDDAKVMAEFGIEEFGLNRHPSLLRSAQPAILLTVVSDELRA